jgi:hypothetical protein
LRKSILAIVLAVCILPGMGMAAQAKGVPFKGQLIMANGVMSQTTGNCMCNANWYTLGANPGSLTITATLQGYSLPFTTSYGVRMFLYAGKRSVNGGQAACTTSQKRCHQQAVLRVRVRTPTIYYLQVYGPGASVVYYSLRVSGKIRRLHCAKTCS